ncbi:molecular chaperone Hsp90 [Lacrimispora sp. JR3]|uniref:molecular chaperone Hsp90 n=1 Tax=Lacrimispora sinapis TaxID=3111456 RepID=UPI003749C504
MDKEVLNYVVEKTHELIDAPSCSSETKEAAQKWLEAVGTEKESEETKRYLAELEEDIVPIDGLIGFAGSEEGMKAFGADLAKNIKAHAMKIKSSGAKYCDCPACTAVEAILEKKDAILN